MTKGARRYFSDKTRLSAVRAALAGEKSFEQIAQEHGITANLLWYWRRKYASKINVLENIPQVAVSAEKGCVEVNSSSPNDHHISLQHEVDQLRKQNQMLCKENQALKELVRQYLTKEIDTNIDT